jgi:hypothetical protein
MKLFIEVELGPDEISLATELFRTMRVLTEHVKTRDIGKLFRALISRLEDTSQLDRVGTEIATLLTENLSSETVSVANPKVLFCFLKTATPGKKKKKSCETFFGFDWW